MNAHMNAFIDIESQVARHIACTGSFPRTLHAEIIVAPNCLIDKSDAGKIILQ